MENCPELDSFLKVYLEENCPKNLKDSGSRKSCVGCDDRETCPKTFKELNFR
jgi:hypothetical protein